MNNIKKMIPYLTILMLTFYMLPLLIKDTGTAMLILLIVMPIVSFTISLFYGIKEKFNVIFTIAAMLLFIPTVFIYYNSSAFIYVIIYGFISLVANFIGSKLK